MIIVLFLLEIKACISSSPYIFRLFCSMLWSRKLWPEPELESEYQSFGSGRVSLSS
jgi:hypothetical protein